MAVAAGAERTIMGPAGHGHLLLRGSGVALLEHTIGERLPGYADYVRRTSPFIPRPPRRRAQSADHSALNGMPSCRPSLLEGTLSR